MVLNIEIEHSIFSSFFFFEVLLFLSIRLIDVLIVDSGYRVSSNDC